MDRAITMLMGIILMFGAFNFENDDVKINPFPYIAFILFIWFYI